jgi:hypothetical protein
MQSQFRDNVWMKNVQRYVTPRIATLTANTKYLESNVYKAAYKDNNLPVT